MKQKNSAALVIVIAFFTAIFSFVLSSLIFKPAQNRSTKVPTAGNISTTFPDIKHDSNYTPIFNSKALDPAVPLNTNSNPNNQPFTGAPQ
jgi:hypothetical protein